MSDQPKASVEMRDFRGLVTEGEGSDLAPGEAIDQNNCTSDDVGFLKSRYGFVPVSFEG